MLYHLRGIKNSHSRWTPTRQWLSHHLIDFLKPTDTIAIVGPNAGYLLAPQLFHQNQTCWLIDTDGQATKRFAQRHPGPEYFPATKNLLTYEDKLDSSRSFHKLIEHIKPDKILFSNILGQLPVLSPVAFENTNLADTEKIILSWLNTGVPTASFHDRLSCHTQAQQLKNLSIDGHWTDDELAVIFFEDKSEVTTHQMEFIGRSARTVDNHVWSLDKNTQHIIEFTRF